MEVNYEKSITHSNHRSRNHFRSKCRRPDYRNSGILSEYRRQLLHHNLHDTLYRAGLCNTASTGLCRTGSPGQILQTDPSAAASLQTCTAPSRSRRTSRSQTLNLTTGVCPALKLKLFYKDHQFSEMKTGLKCHSTNISTPVFFSGRKVRLICRQRLQPVQQPVWRWVRGTDCRRRSSSPLHSRMQQRQIHRPAHRRYRLSDRNGPCGLR